VRHRLGCGGLDWDEPEVGSAAERKHAVPSQQRGVLTVCRKALGAFAEQVLWATCDAHQLSRYERHAVPPDQRGVDNIAAGPLLIPLFLFPPPHAAQPAARPSTAQALLAHSPHRACAVNESKACTATTDSANNFQDDTLLVQELSPDVTT